MTLLLSRRSWSQLLPVGVAALLGAACAQPLPSLAAAPQSTLYVTPADLLGVVAVSGPQGRQYRLTAQGSQGVMVDAAQLRQQGGELLIPVSLLRSLGCVLTPTEEALTVACGRVSVGMRPRLLPAP